MLDQQLQAPEVTGDLYSPEVQLSVLEHRLERGWRIIESKEALGEPTDALVAHFLELLKQYEDAYDLAHAA